MIKKVLTTIGFIEAPSPLRRILGVKALFGTLPALAYLGWRYRHRIASFLHAARDASGLDEAIASNRRSADERGYPVAATT